MVGLSEAGDDDGDKQGKLTGDAVVAELLKCRRTPRNQALMDEGVGQGGSRDRGRMMDKVKGSRACSPRRNQ